MAIEIPKRIGYAGGNLKGLARVLNEMSAAIDLMSGLSAGELTVLDAVVAGTVSASKAVVAGTNKNVDVLAVADLKLGSGAGTSVTATAAELNAAEGLPFDYTITPAAGAANVCEVTIQALDANGDEIAHVAPLLVWLSDAATGAGLTDVSASGAVAAAAGSTDLAALTAKKALMVQTAADGSYVLSITDTAKTAFKVCAQSLNGEIPTVATLETASYGA